jgi:hypothetical protein
VAFDTRRHVQERAVSASQVFDLIPPAVENNAGMLVRDRAFHQHNVAILFATNHGVALLIQRISSPLSGRASTTSPGMMSLHPTGCHSFQFAAEAD